MKSARVTRTDWRKPTGVPARAFMAGSFHNHADEGIGDYYRRKDEEKSAAWAALEAARARGASAEEIRKLEKAHERAAYVGD